jgi:hypothetical protein
MRIKPRNLGSLLTALALVLPAAVAGCATHRYYDDEYRDYHRWDGDETIFYLRWESDTHRDHRDFFKRSDPEKREYWEWRHRGHDRGRDRDHDRDRD